MKKIRFTLFAFLVSVLALLSPLTLSAQVHQNDSLIIKLDTTLSCAKGTELFIPHYIADHSVSPIFNVLSLGKGFSSIEISYSLDQGNIMSQSFFNFAKLDYSQQKSLILDSLMVDPGTHQISAWVSKLDGIDFPSGISQEITTTFIVNYNNAIAMPLIEANTYTNSLYADDVSDFVNFNASVLYKIFENQGSSLNLAMYPLDSRENDLISRYVTPLGLDTTSPTQMLNGGFFRTNATDYGQIMAELDNLIAVAPKHSNFEITTPLFIYGMNQEKTFQYDLTLNSNISGNFRVYYAILETQTWRHLPNRGEDPSYQTVENVLNPNGEMISLIAGKPLELKSMINISSKSYEDVNNLRLVLFIKDTNINPTVLQSIQIPIRNYLGNEENNNALNDQFKLYPNPAKDVCHFVISEKASLEVFDGMGRLIESKSLEKGNCDLDLRRFKAGNYTLRLIEPNKTSYSKLSIIK